MSVSAAVAEGALTFPVSHEHVCYQNNMMLSLTLLNAAHLELHLLFSGKSFSLCILSLTYITETAQDKI